jgi:RNA polymerase sigma factor (sigma-70 family)
VGVPDATSVTSDLAAGEFLLRLYVPGARRLKAFLFRRGCPHAWLDDVAQEALLRALQGWGSFRGDASFNGYVLGIAQNVLREFRRLHQGTKSAGGDPSAIPAPPRDSPSSQLDLDELLELMEKHLSPKQWQMVQLVWCEQLTPTEIANRMGCEPEVVRNRLARARKIVRDFLPALRYEEP